MSKVKDIFVVTLFLFIAIWSVGPIVKNPHNFVTDTWDGVFFVWQENINIQKIPNDLGSLFEGNIFYPYKNVKAYSDLFIPSSFLLWLPVKLIGEPVFATSLLIIFGQIALLLILYKWLCEFSQNNYSALLGTLAFSLSQIRFHYQVHLQMWIMVWVITAMYFIWKFTQTNKIKYLYLSFIFAAVQIWESPLPVFFYALYLLATLVFNFKKFRKNTKHLIIAGAIFIILSMPAIWVYFKVSNEFDYVRPIREVAHFSASVDDYWKLFLSPGLYILTGVSLIKYFLQREKDKKIFKFFSILVFSFFIMTLGPVLKWGSQTVKIFDGIFIPLPYGILYYVLPGFGGLRTPSRWIWMFGLTLSFIIAYAFRNWKFRKNLLLSFGLIAITIIGGTRIKTVYKVPRFQEYPQVYKWLKDQPGRVILEYPMYTWGAGDIAKTESYRMMYSLYHKKSLVNGYSGFNPPDWEKFVNRVNGNFPDEKVVSELHTIGVDYVVIDKSNTEENVRRLVGENYMSNVVWEDGNYLVLEFQ